VFLQEKRAGDIYRCSPNWIISLPHLHKRSAVAISFAFMCFTCVWQSCSLAIVILDEHLFDSGAHSRRESAILHVRRVARRERRN
jgi:hypothetical protein